MDARQSVLIVDRQEETREVLHAALGRRGWRILSTDRADEGLDLADRERPDVVVLDLDSLDDAARPLGRDFSRVTAAHQGRLIVLGQPKRHDRHWSPSGAVSKPYHYAALIRTIESSVDAAGPPLRRSA